MTLPDLEWTDSPENRLHEVRAALLRAPAGLTPLLEAALGPIMGGAGASWGLLLALGDGVVRAAAQGGEEIAEATELGRVEPLWTQGIAGYAAARGLPVLVRDIGADPRWGPPSLDSGFPQAGAALAAPLGEPADAVLVLVAPDAEAFTDERLAWVQQALEWLRQPLSSALMLDRALEALNKLDQRDHQRRDLRTMALHDMRGQLQNIQMAFKAVERQVATQLDVDDAAPVLDMIQMGQHSAARLANVSKTLLNVPRLQDDQLLPEAHVAPLDATIAGALAATGALIEASDCKVETELAPQLPAVPHDPVLVERVIANLIDNAIKYAPPGSAITVSAEPFRHGVCVRVADRGPGVPADQREEIFTRYYQPRPQNSAKLDGIGLGLAFCRLAVTAHGGDIWVENGAQTGAVFTFTLPGPRGEV